MTPYMSRGPFTILVHPDFPTNPAFTLLDKGHTVALSLQDCTSDSNSHLPQMSLDVGPGFSVSCDLSVGDGTAVRAFTLTNAQSAFVDLDANGTYDMRTPLDSQRLEVRYNQEWVPVVIGDGRPVGEKRLLGGQLVAFDTQAGEWRLQVEQRTKPPSGDAGPPERK
jgi:hypothetical protein